MDAKRIAFVAMLSALGIVLSAISLNIVFTGGGTALDLSHIATFVAAIFGGPIVGATVGLFGGLYAGYFFGFVYSQGPIAIVAVSLGKALTGLTAGLLYKKLKIGNNPRRSILTVPVTLISYIPECIFTIIYFLYIITLVSGQGMAFMIPAVIPKAWMEIAVMSILMGALVGNVGFREFMGRYLHTQTVRKPT